MFERASRKLGLDQAVLSGIENKKEGKLSGKEIASLLRHGAYGALTEGDSAKFDEEDIDEILGRSEKKQTYNSAAEVGSSFSSAHFAINVGGTDVSVDDGGKSDASSREEGGDARDERVRAQGAL